MLWSKDIRQELLRINPHMRTFLINSSKIIIQPEKFYENLFQ